MKNRIFAILSDDLSHLEVRQSKSSWLDNEIEKLENIVNDKTYHLDYKEVIENSIKLFDISSQDDLDNKKLEYTP